MQQLKYGRYYRFSYMHAKKGFYIKKLGENVDLYLKNDALLLADVFGKYREMCLRIYRLNQLLD